MNIYEISFSPTGGTKKDKICQLSHINMLQRQ